MSPQAEMLGGKGCYWIVACLHRGAHGLSASWYGNGVPRRRRVAGLRGWPATRGLRHGPDSYGRQQWGIFRKGRKPDGVTPRVGRRPSGRKPLSVGKKGVDANTVGI